MTDARHRGLWHRTGLIGGAGAMLLLAAAAQGCSDEPASTTTTTSTSTSTGTGGTGGGAGGEGGGTGGAGGGAGGAGGGSASIEISAACTGSDTSFSTPFDATPDPEGLNVYFTALNANGEAGVFKGPSAGGGACNPIHQGDPLVAPFNIAIASDSKTLFLADSGSDDAAETDSGHVFTLPASGGAPAIFIGTEGRRPRGIDVYKDADAELLYFTGTDPITGERGVFSVISAGGQVSAVAKGAAFKDPSGIVVSSKKTAYVCDTTGTESEIANILSVDAQGNVTTLVSGIHAGYPCGIALTVDEGLLFVSAIDAATGTDVIARIKVDTKDVDYLSKGIETFTESAGLHRARNADSYAWADSKANGKGTVFTVKLQ